jgi:prevent-host-death family protein
MIKISLEKAKIRLAELLEEVVKGEEVVITIKNKPVAKLVPLTHTAVKPERKLGSAKGKIWMSDDFDEPLRFV